jgi:hypothetical protein
MGVANSLALKMAGITKGRGRDGHHWPPPAQIRTGAASAYGSYLRCMASKRTCG